MKKKRKLKKKVKIILLILFIIIITISILFYWKYKSLELKEKSLQSEKQELAELTDIKESDWYYEAYIYLKKENAFSNIQFDGELKAEEKINKNMLITMVYNLFGTDKNTSDIKWVKDNNLLQTYDDETISTEEMLFMVYQIASLLNKDTTIPDSNITLFGYSDREEVSDFAYDGVSWCIKEKIYIVDNDILNIKENLTRAQAIDILYKGSLYLKDNQSMSESTIIPSPIQNTSEHVSLQNEIDTLSKNHGAVGVSVALIEDGKVTDTFAYGDAIIGTSKMTPDTKLRIASLSKAFVGLATMISVENGTMSLDDDIGKYWGFPINTHTQGDVITVRSLLNHTSSIIDVSENTSNTYYNSMRNNLLSGSSIRNIVSGNIQNWNYNNYGFAVLGVTTELANNMELGNFLKTYIFDPLNIDASFYGGDLVRPDLIGNAYYYGGSVGRSSRETKSYFPDGVPGSNGGSFAGGVVISAYDLGKIVALLANDGEYNGVRYLPSNIISNLEYHENNFKGPFWQAQPLRYITNVYGQDELYYLGGDAYGVHNLVAYNPNTKKGVVVLTSGANFIYDDELSNTLCAGIARLLFNKN